MARRKHNREVRVQVGESTVTVTRGGSLNGAQARLLGDEVAGGVRRIYLDRRVHLPGEDMLGEWSCSGAISTILEQGIDAGARAA